jgi:hypothetical protein
MEVYNRRAVLTEIENNPELRDGYESNLVLLLKVLAKGAATLATGGLVIPAYYLFKWLMSMEQTLEFVKFPTLPEITQFKRKPLKDPTLDVTITLREADEIQKTGCLFCDARNHGLFFRNW